ncbi:SDR family oxidoreductase [Roseomonas indoligenes]|uniref:SDR family NAD(P)-dependent oxidoreductase n=1 Tax=Roseomonas indoligenes TaxID=2820811 RepID=A0A940S8H5_9PROT|nr:SDR family oxidoreductase [Pararoseomonas indoligenes]MBP0494188.1 SDR family NAD(P)-dependent oxidoreductase [Pararoseomonas indoligenes]
MPAPKLKPLSEQVIVITGASSGIGLATARMAAERGASLVLVARNGEALNALAEEIRAKGGRAEPVVADVADMAQVEAISARAIEAFGGFDSWCNNAGVAIYGELEDVPLDDQRRLFDTNYWGVVHGTLVAARHLKGKAGGAIVNTGSVLSERAMTLQGPYSASKFAVKGVTEAFRTEFEAEGYPISVTLIKPGPIDTPYMEHARNLLGSPGTRNPPPAYHPRVAARAILHACETRTRDLYVGGGGFMMSMMGTHFPRLTDMIFEKIARPTQESEETGRMERRDNLYEPREDLAETSSLSGPPPRKTSFLLEAQMNPLGPAGLLIGAAALLGGAAIGMYTLRRPKPVPQRLADRAWHIGHRVARDAGHGIGTLGHEASRIAHRALDYAERAEREARPHLKRARKHAEHFADKASRYASSVYDDARDRGGDLYDEARDRGRGYYKQARGRGEDLYDTARRRGAEGYDDARDRGWSLFKRARNEGQDAYEETRDRGWSLFGRARDRGEEVYDRARKRGEDSYDEARDRGWSLFGRARDQGEETYNRARKRGRDAYEDARDEGWSLFGHARKEVDRRSRQAVQEGDGLLDRINAFLKSRL